MFLQKNMIYFKEKKGFTPYKLKQLGVPLTTTQQIIDGTTEDPRLSILLKLIKIYDISLDDLIFKDLSIGS